jgi:hypothetical protein
MAARVPHAKTGTRHTRDKYPNSALFVASPQIATPPKAKIEARIAMPSALIVLREGIERTGIVGERTALIERGPKG